MPLHPCPWCPQKFRDPSYWIRHVMGHREKSIEERAEETNKIRIKYGLPTVEVIRESEVNRTPVSTRTVE